MPAGLRDRSCRSELGHAGWLLGGSQGELCGVWIRASRREVGVGWAGGGLVMVWAQVEDWREAMRGLDVDAKGKWHSVW